MIDAVAKGHVVVHGRATTSSSSNVHDTITTEGHKDVYDLCHSLMLCCCSWIMLPLAVMLVSTACPDNGYQTDVSVLYFHQNPCGNL